MSKGKIFVKYFSKKLRDPTKSVYYRIYSSQQSRKDKGQPKPNPDLGRHKHFGKEILLYWWNNGTMEDLKLILNKYSKSWKNLPKLWNGYPDLKIILFYEIKTLRLVTEVFYPDISTHDTHWTWQHWPAWWGGATYVQWEGARWVAVWLRWCSPFAWACWP